MLKKYLTLIFILLIIVLVGIVVWSRYKSVDPFNFVPPSAEAPGVN